MQKYRYEQIRYLAAVHLYKFDMIIFICTKMLKLAFYIRIQKMNIVTHLGLILVTCLILRLNSFGVILFLFNLFHSLIPRLCIHANVRQIRLNCFNTVLTFLICKYSCQANMHVGTLIQILNLNIFTTVEKCSNQFSNNNLYAHVTSYINYYILF